MNSSFRVTALTLVTISMLVGCVSKDKEPRVKTRKVIYDMETSKPVSIAEIKAKIEEEPDNPQPYFMLGEAHEKENKLLLARDNYIEGMLRFKNAKGYSKKAKYTGGHYRLARVYARLGGYLAAIDHCQQIVKMTPKKNGQVVRDLAAANPDFREAHYLLGACYNELQDLNKAEVHFKEFIKLGGSQERAATHLVRIERLKKGLDSE